MKIFAQSDNVLDAVDAVVKAGVAAVHGTTAPATDYCERIIKALRPYGNVEPTIGYQNVEKQGYLYYVYDTARFQTGDSELKGLLHELDRRS